MRAKSSSSSLICQGLTRVVGSRYRTQCGDGARGASRCRPRSRDAGHRAPRGVFSRQLVLGQNLDTDKIAASYDGGVLRLRIPVAEKAKPRKIAIGRSNGHQVINA